MLSRQFYDPKDLRFQGTLHPKITKIGQQTSNSEPFENDILKPCVPKSLNKILLNKAELRFFEKLWKQDETSVLHNFWWKCWLDDKQS